MQQYTYALVNRWSVNRSQLTAQCSYRNDTTLTRELLRTRSSMYHVSLSHLIAIIASCIMHQPAVLVRVLLVMRAQQKVHDHNHNHNTTTQQDRGNKQILNTNSRILLLPATSTISRYIYIVWHALKGIKYVYIYICIAR